MGIIQRLREKPQIKARATSAIMGSLMIAGMGAALVTGNAAAMDPGSYFMSNSILTYAFAIMAAIGMIATIILEDIRLLVPTGLLAVLAFACAYLGL